MTSRIRKIPVEIPASHAFARFLTNLPMDEACDPYPDIIERAAGERYFVGFMGDNCRARQQRLFDFIKSPLDTGAQIVSQHFGESSCRAVIYLTRFTPVIAPGAFERINDAEQGSTWLVPRNAPSLPPTKVEDDNCTVMPTY